MAEPFVLDTSAILTLTGNEPGANEVEACLNDAVGGSVDLFGSFVALTDVHYITLQEEGEAVAAARLADLNALPIRWIHSDPYLCAAAANLKATHRMSFADAFVAATALRFAATLVHEDPEFLAIVSMVKQRMLPPNTTARVHRDPPQFRRQERRPRMARIDTNEDGPASAPQPADSLLNRLGRARLCSSSFVCIRAIRCRLFSPSGDELAR